MSNIKSMAKAACLVFLGLASAAIITTEAKAEKYSSLPSAGIDFFFSDNPVSVKDIKKEKEAKTKKADNKNVNSTNSVKNRPKTAGFDDDFAFNITDASQYKKDADIFAHYEVEIDNSVNIQADETAKAVDESNDNGMQSPETATSEKTDNVTETSQADNAETASPESEATSDGNEAANEETPKEDISEVEIEESIIPTTEKTLKETERDIDARKEEEGFKNLVIAQCNGWVNVRSESNEDSDVVGKLYNKSAGEFIEEQDGWYKISSGSVTGFVKAEYCVTGDDAVELAKQVGTRIATVTSDNGMYVREEPSTEAAKICTVATNEVLTVSEELDGWAKVNVEEGDYYVSLDFVKLSTEFVKAESKEEEEARLAREERERQAAREAANQVRQNNENNTDNTTTTNTGGKGRYNPTTVVTHVTSGGSELGIQVANYALQFNGNPYVYGGSDPVNGADCSGFVMAIYKHFGVSLPHSANADRKMGYEVEGGLANAEPGDLICYSGHVGIYIGSGQIIHASTTKTGIKISDANYRQPLAVRRIF